MLSASPVADMIGVVVTLKSAVVVPTLKATSSPFEFVNPNSLVFVGVAVCFTQLPTVNESVASGSRLEVTSRFGAQIALVPITFDVVSAKLVDVTVNAFGDESVRLLFISIALFIGLPLVCSKS